MNSRYARKLPARWKRFASIYASLGDSYRQRILLLFQPGEELTVTQIADVLPLSRSAVVHHVRSLVDAGVLSRRKRGREVFLKVDTALLVETLTRTLDYTRTSL